MKMSDRFKFRAWVKDAYLSDEDGNDYRKSFLIYGVAVFGGCRAGHYTEDFERQLEEQGFSEDEIEQIKECDPDFDSDWFNFDADEIEQGTGINDANGKLVFEGDIVKTKHDDVGVVVYSDHFLEWRIVFKKGRRHLLDNGEFGVPMFDFTENAIGKNILKIIGNTHQNPELLK